MLTVILHRVGFTSEEVHVYSVEEASATVTAFQRKYAMGASDMGSAHGKVYVGNTMVHTVSYNGRVWGRADVDKTLFNKLVFDPGDSHACDECHLCCGLGCKSCSTCRNSK